MVGLTDLLSPGLLNLPAVQERLDAKLDPRDLIALFKVSKGIRLAVHTAMKSSAFDINAARAKFVSNSREFRSHQAQCNALLHSKFARAFFDRTTDCTNLCISCDKDMDNGESAQAYACFRGYLYQEGYVHKIDNDGEYEPWMTKIAANDQILCIYLTHKTSPIVDAFFQATTADLNAISWNKAFSFFPNDIVKHEGLLLQDLNNAVDPDEKPVSENLVALSQAGFRTKAMPWRVPKHLTDLRKVGDSQTWVVELATGGIKPCHVPDVVLETNTFRILPPGEPREDKSHRLIGVPRSLRSGTGSSPLGGRTMMKKWYAGLERCGKSTEALRWWKREKSRAIALLGEKMLR
jgi:hypothetical protein